MPQEGLCYRNRNAEQHVGIGVENAKSFANIGVIFRTWTSMAMTDWQFVIGPVKYSKPHSDTIESFKHVPTFQFGTFREFFDKIPLATELVGVELDPRSTDLETFDHPDRAVYLFGGETEGLSRQARDACRKIIKLPAPHGVSMNLSSTAVAVMWDRYMKQKAKHGRDNSN